MQTITNLTFLQNEPTDDNDDSTGVGSDQEDKSLTHLLLGVRMFS